MNAKIFVKVFMLLPSMLFASAGSDQAPNTLRHAPVTWLQVEQELHPESEKLPSFDEALKEIEVEHPYMKKEFLNALSSKLKHDNHNPPIKKRYHPRSPNIIGIGENKSKYCYLGSSIATGKRILYIKLNYDKEIIFPYSEGELLISIVSETVDDQNIYKVYKLIEIKEENGDYAFNLVVDPIEEYFDKRSRANFIDSMKEVMRFMRCD